ncbi:MAG: alpha/beta fold hydrolase [Solirubrobacteraceae bacterium]
MLSDRDEEPRGGFPEHAYSWRHQVDPVAAAGFRVIVPNQRGYAGTSATADVDDYSVKNLVADVSGLLDALGIEQAVWFGHDWGSMPAWYAGVYDPDRVLGVGSLCTPYFTPGDADLVEIYDELRGPKHYMRTFQEPGYARGAARTRRRGYVSRSDPRAWLQTRSVQAGAEGDSGTARRLVRRRSPVVRRPDPDGGRTSLLR